MQYAPRRRSRWTAVVPIAVLGAFILGPAATAYGSSALAGPAPAARAIVVTGVVGHNDRTSVVSPRHPSGLGHHGDKPKPTDPPTDPGPASPDPVDPDPAGPDPTTANPEPSGSPTVPAPESTSSPDGADDPATSGPSARPTATPAGRPSTRSKDARSPATTRTSLTPRSAAPAVLLRPGQAPPLPEVAGPDRVPTGGSEPYADPTPPPPPPEPPTQSIGSLLAGEGTGSKIFVAGLAGLVIAVVGLVTVVVRRRQW